MSIIDRVGPIIDTVMGANQGRRDKQRRRENALMGTSIALGLIGNFKRNKYLEKADQASIDQWINMGKARNDIAELKREKEEMAPYTKALTGIDLTNMGHVEAAIGDSIHQKVMNTHQDMVATGKAGEFPTRKDFLANSNGYFSPEGIEKINTAYQDELNNIIQRVKTGKKIDLPNLEYHFSQLEQNKLNSDFIKDASLLNLFTGKTEKRLNKKVSGFDQYTKMFISDSVRDNAAAINDLKDANNIQESRNALKNHTMSDVYRMNRNTLEILQLMHPEVKAAKLKELETELNAVEQVNGKIPVNELDQISDRLFFNMINPSVGLELARKNKATRTRLVYEDDTLSDKEKEIKYSYIDKAYRSNIETMQAINELEPAQKELHKINTRQNRRDYRATLSPEERRSFDKVMAASEMSGDPIISSFIAKIAEQEELQRINMQYDSNTARQNLNLQKDVVSALQSNGLPLNVKGLEDLQKSNLITRQEINKLLSIPFKDRAIFMLDYTYFDGKELSDDRIPIVEKTLKSVEEQNPMMGEIAELIRKGDKSANIFFGNMLGRVQWFIEENKKIESLSSGINLDRDRMYKLVLQSDAINEDVGIKDGKIVFHPDASAGPRESTLRKIFNEPEAQSYFRNLKVQRDANQITLASLGFKYDEEDGYSYTSNYGKEIDNLAADNPEEAIVKLNNSRLELINMLNQDENISERDQKDTIRNINKISKNLIDTYSPNRIAWKEDKFVLIPQTQAGQVKTMLENRIEETKNKLDKLPKRRNLRTGELLPDTVSKTYKDLNLDLEDYQEKYDELTEAMQIKATYENPDKSGFRFYTPEAYRQAKKTIRNMVGE